MKHMNVILLYLVAFREMLIKFLNLFSSLYLEKSELHGIIHRKYTGVLSDILGRGEGVDFFFLDIFQILRRSHKHISSLDPLVSSIHIY